MVVKDGHTDPEYIPPDIHNILGKTAVLDFNIKKDETMAINKATITETITPETPNPKQQTTKKRTHSATGNFHAYFFYK